MSETHMDPEQQAREIREWRRKMRPRPGQQDVADAVGVSLGTIQNLEGGKKNTHPDTIRAVREYLGMPGDETATIASWPDDVKVITDMVGAWLVAQTPAVRHEFSLEMTRRIIGNHT